MKISIANRNSNATTLAHFFKGNLTASYISHSELQGHRAIAPGEWAKDVESVFSAEIQARLADPIERFPPKNFWQGVIEAHDETSLVGMALVTLSPSANVPFGIVEDIVIDMKCRGKGYGEIMMRWIMDQFRDAGAKRVFLESGIDNDSAHHLFERIGFKTVSVVMMRDL